ncbi:MAG: hypothetical protein AW09_001291 [Candidatus Accumulibacter phosphatis]|uniref:Uncharacterized protein n=1 Tax=Candidatus Accumulibacter phosphatis TaxID=327160 RepID=A0A080M8J3_9PROT|nr:MAG: hypothetical protein AW09_001291 [Candidatus Accumulibacter phosphatis]
MFLVVRLVQAALQNQVGEDRLLLLPPGLAIMPDKAVHLLARRQRALDHVIPATADLVGTDRGHQLGDLLGQFDVIGTRTNAVDPHQVPGDLEIVADYRAVLLPVPGAVVAPVFMEALLDKWRMLVVGEVLDDGVGGVSQEIGVLVLTRRQPEVDQVGRGVIADRVPVLAGAVVALVEQ